MSPRRPELIDRVRILINEMTQEQRVELAAWLAEEIGWPWNAPDEALDQRFTCANCNRSRVEHYQGSVGDPFYCPDQDGVAPMIWNPKRGQ